MTIAIGDRLPDAEFLVFGPEGPKAVTVDEIFSNRSVALFGVPGAFTPTCHNQHVPSFVEASQALAGKGVEEIVCISVNDPFVMAAWGEATGAGGAGIRMLADADGAFTRAIGLDFSAPPAGLLGRSQRYSMHVEDRVVKVLNVEDSPGEATCSLGGALAERI